MLLKHIKKILLHFLNIIFFLNFIITNTFFLYVPKWVTILLVKENVWA